MRSLSERVLLLTVAKAYEMFMQEQQFRGNSRETIAYYKITLNMFMDFCGRDLDIDELDVILFKSYQMHLDTEKDIKRVSVQTYARAVRVFYRYLYFEDLLDIDINKLKLMKSKKESILPLTDAELNKLISCFNMDIFLDVRNRLICQLMFDCGLRRGEIVNLKTSDISINNCTMLINGKGSKQRVVPFGQCTKEFILKYSSYVPCDSIYFFVNNDGSPITSNTIKKLFVKLKEKSGISRLYPHLLRHTFATNYIYNGGNLEVLRVLLGHSSINITQVYVHLATQMHLVNDTFESHLDKLNKAP